MPTYSAKATPDGALNIFNVWSGEVEDFTLSWVNRLGAENISASGVSAFHNWYVPAGATAYQSATALGASASTMRLSATATAGYQFRVSARILTTSGRSIFDYFDIRMMTGV